MNCSCDAHPPVSSYQWHNDMGEPLHEGNIFLLSNVSRNHTGGLYCTATNTEGQGRSSPVHLNVLCKSTMRELKKERVKWTYGLNPYCCLPDAPEVKATSSCSSKANMVNCVCIVESKPPSNVQFVLSDRVLSGTKVEKDGPVTISTLQTELEPYESVLCLAFNTQGNASLKLFSPVNSKI